MLIAILYRFTDQVQWEYRDDDDSFLPYPPEINMKIEKARSDKKPFYKWDESGTTFRITYSSMKEEICGEAGSGTDVRSKGQKGQTVEPNCIR